MAGHSFDLDALVTFSQALDGFLRALTAEMQNVATAAGDIGDGFHGETADAFAAAHTAWQTEVAALAGRLSDYRTLIDNAHLNYEQARLAISETLGTTTAG
ncbi:WXG100 family type VII secretion target [Nocardia testacea]|uniref:WXG100 family type VII secretion target n=1 Tax=Nocardia testacea TaxID=248551 RepID=UPI003A857D41